MATLRKKKAFEKLNFITDREPLPCHKNTNKITCDIL